MKVVQVELLIRQRGRERVLQLRPIEQQKICLKSHDYIVKEEKCRRRRRGEEERKREEEKEKWTEE